MASIAANAAGAAANKKTSRPNPARRKASKAKVLSAESSAGLANNARSPTKRRLSGNLTVSVSKDFRSKQTSADPAAKKVGVSTTKPVDPLQLQARVKAIESDSKEPSPKHDIGTLTLAAPAVLSGGLIGCVAGAAVILGAGLWKNFAGADNAILAARTAKLCLDNLIEEIITSLKAGTYNAPEALDMLRRTTLAYAGSIPGGAPLVERTFHEIEMVRRQRGAEVDKVLAEASQEVARASKNGANADELQAIVFTQMMRLSTFATNATQDVLARNPKLRPFRDGAVKTLRRTPQSKVPTVKVNMAIQHKSIPVV